ncbi:unnamed protein product [Vitrella brassicaformis CCMP3155]|uniref:Uncharacterized protein n=4 Tax=Vitrella brassicaformis TaxID=1169539 RepID=A0A0G4ED22_VITBC|nr:unnamed protein product [Vitrella brassicaformis CCMP3155]|eukprot:CEL93577.1 unnamed protein product [Vitrella brassicaformis CCMP3155]
MADPAPSDVFVSFYPPREGVAHRWAGSPTSSPSLADLSLQPLMVLAADGTSLTLKYESGAIAVRYEVVRSFTSAALYPSLYGDLSGSGGGRPSAPDGPVEGCRLFTAYEDQTMALEWFDSPGVFRAWHNVVGNPIAFHHKPIHNKHKQFFKGSGYLQGPHGEVLAEWCDEPHGNPFDPTLTVASPPEPTPARTVLLSRDIGFTQHPTEGFILFFRCAGGEFMIPFGSVPTWPAVGRCEPALWPFEEPMEGSLASVGDVSGEWLRGHVVSLRGPEAVTRQPLTESDMDLLLHNKGVALVDYELEVRTRHQFMQQQAAAKGRKDKNTNTKAKQGKHGGRVSEGAKVVPMGGSLPPPAHMSRGHSMVAAALPMGMPPTQVSRWEERSEASTDSQRSGKGEGKKTKAKTKGVMNQWLRRDLCRLRTSAPHYTPVRSADMTCHPHQQPQTIYEPPPKTLADAAIEMGFDVTAQPPPGPLRQDDITRRESECDGNQVVESSASSTPLALDGNLWDAAKGIGRGVRHGGGRGVGGGNDKGRRPAERPSKEDLRDDLWREGDIGEGEGSAFMPREGFYATSAAKGGPVRVSPPVAYPPQMDEEVMVLRGGVKDKSPRAQDPLTMSSHSSPFKTYRYTNGGTLEGQHQQRPQQGGNGSSHVEQLMALQERLKQERMAQRQHFYQDIHHQNLQYMNIQQHQQQHLLAPPPPTFPLPARMPPPPQQLPSSYHVAFETIGLSHNQQQLMHEAPDGCLLLTGVGDAEAEEYIGPVDSQILGSPLAQPMMPQLQDDRKTAAAAAGGGGGRMVPLSVQKGRMSFAALRQKMGKAASEKTGVDKGGGDGGVDKGGGGGVLRSSGLRSTLMQQKLHQRAQQQQQQQQRAGTIAKVAGKRTAVGIQKKEREAGDTEAPKGKEEQKRPEPIPHGSAVSESTTGPSSKRETDRKATPPRKKKQTIAPPPKESTTHKESPATPPSSPSRRSSANPSRSSTPYKRRSRVNPFQALQPPHFPALTEPKPKVPVFPKPERPKSAGVGQRKRQQPSVREEASAATAVKVPGPAFKAGLARPVPPPRAKSTGRMTVPSGVARDRSPAVRQPAAKERRANKKVVQSKSPPAAPSEEEKKAKAKAPLIEPGPPHGMLSLETIKAGLLQKEVGGEVKTGPTGILVGEGEGRLVWDSSLGQLISLPAQDHLHHPQQQQQVIQEQKDKSESGKVGDGRRLTYSPPRTPPLAKIFPFHMQWEMLEASPMPRDIQDREDVTVRPPAAKASLVKPPLPNPSLIANGVTGDAQRDGNGAPVRAADREGPPFVFGGGVVSRPKKHPEEPQPTTSTTTTRLISLTGGKSTPSLLSPANPPHPNPYTPPAVVGTVPPIPPVRDPVHRVASGGHTVQRMATGPYRVAGAGLVGPVAYAYPLVAAWQPPVMAVPPHGVQGGMPLRVQVVGVSRKTLPTRMG